MRFSSLAAVGVVALSACSEAPITTPTAPLTTNSGLASVAGEKSYVIVASGNHLPADLATSVASAGGTLTARLDDIGVAVATSSSASFLTQAAKIAGIQGLEEDVMLQFTRPTVADESVETSSDVSAVESSAAVGSTESFRLMQWAPDAVHAPEAWAAGYQGAGARVAVLDGGIDPRHVDIGPIMDVARSTSFVPGFSFDQDVGGFWHGMHVAGIIAAPAQGIGTVGIAPKAKIIGVKVLHNGSGLFSWIISGIVYAAKPVAEGGAGANIINMSLGAMFPNNVEGARPLLNALSRATMYARQRGVTVIAAAGNESTDLDHTANLMSVPAQSVGVIAVAASAPQGWAFGSTNLDRPASYTNYGQSAITLAAPGGDFTLFSAFPNQICSRPRLPIGSGTVFQFCWAMDMVVAPGFFRTIDGRSLYSWAAGTSMASPTVAGVAALIVGKHPGISPAQVEAILRSSADDLGKPGNDDFYGRGRVNAARAVQQ